MPTSHDYQVIVETIRQKYPLFTPHTFDVITGSGPGRSVFYPAHARQNPRPGRNVIETREEGRTLQTPHEIEVWLTCEMFKLLTMTDNDGKLYAQAYRAEVPLGC